MSCTARGRNVRDGRNRSSRSGIRRCPRHIAADPLAKAAWERQGTDLLTRGLLSPSYGDLLASLALTTADLERARSLLASMSYQVVTLEEFPDAAGRMRRRLRPNPVRRECERLVDQQAKLLAEFGSSPAASARVTAVPRDA
jgi:phage terminase small subunit